MSLEITDIRKSFGRFPALKGVTLNAQDGEFLALLGPSGSGKTTLLRVIAGLETAEEGAIRFRGADLSEIPVRERKIGFVFQHYALFRHMTAAQNIAFGMRAKRGKERASNKVIKAKVAELLSLVQLEALGGRFPSQLSGGQRQRVALARALAIEPDLLLLDEPFGALDAQVRRELRRWLRGLHEQTGLTTIFVTHDQEEALELADRVALLRDGQLEQVGAPNHLYHEPQSAFAFEFLGDTIKLPCQVDGENAIIGGKSVPIRGVKPPQGDAIAFARPDAFDVVKDDGGPGIEARVRTILSAGPDARLDLILKSGDGLEVRLPHEEAARLAPKDQVRVAPREVRVWS